MKQILCNSCLTLQITLSKVLDVTLIKRHPKQLLNKSYVVVLIFCLLVLLFSQKNIGEPKKTHTHTKKNKNPGYHFLNFPNSFPPSLCFTPLGWAKPLPGSIPRSLVVQLRGPDLGSNPMGPFHGV